MSNSNPVRRHLSVDRLRSALRWELREEDLKFISGWELLGDIVIIQLPKELEGAKYLIGRKILELHPKAETVLNRAEIKGVFREPQVEVIAGSKTETLHKENGCIFKIDPTKVMFSFGNIEERKRMASISNEDETIVDMFACVGQFSIPMAKHSNPKAVYAIEKNPIAFDFLKENIAINRFRNVHPILGDCRGVSPRKVAHRVVMGYLFDTHKYLPSAINALRDEGGVIHYHTTSHKGGIMEVEETITGIVEEEGHTVKSIQSRIVKSYAPKIYHFVIDIVVG